MIKAFIRKNLIVIIFTITGAAAGFLYWKFVGCKTGTCPIKSIWYMTTLWGLVFGYLTGSIVRDMLAKFNDNKQVTKENDHNNFQK
jgi:hypothetical protein